LRIRRTHDEPPGRGEIKAMAARLDGLLKRAGDDPDELVIMRVADLRRMDAWGVTIDGISLNDYFDLGSIDDVDPDYPVTVTELRSLRRALDTLPHAAHPDRCAPRSAKRLTSRLFV
jgi:hypothetical protein